MVDSFGKPLYPAAMTRAHLRERLPDHASEPDHRFIPIDRVGIKGLAYPITVWDRAHRMQPTIATIDATVSLPASVKGTHMSRFVEVLNGVRGELSLKNLPEVLAQIQRRLHSEKVQLDVSFPYFMEKEAPLSRARSLMQYQAAFHARRDGDHFDFVLEVTVPVTTLCPCSKAVSERGAHNQRSEVKVELRSDPFLWIEEVVEAVESCASAPLYALLKREDEKFVTEQAYDNPRFVEDLIREVVAALRPKATWLKVSVENWESIHNHSAWAELECSSDAEVPCSPKAVPAPETPARFGDWLRGQRASRGWSQQDLAERLGSSASQLSKVEAEERSLNSAQLEKLSTLLGQDPLAVRLRAGLLPPELMERIRRDPEGFLRWGGTVPAPEFSGPGRDGL